jgi:hypothetical protein
VPRSRGCVNARPEDANMGFPLEPAVYCLATGDLRCEMAGRHDRRSCRLTPAAELYSAAAGRFSVSSCKRGLQVRLIHSYLPSDLTVCGAHFARIPCTLLSGVFAPLRRSTICPRTGRARPRAFRARPAVCGAGAAEARPGARTVVSLGEAIRPSCRCALRRAPGTERALP